MSINLAAIFGFDDDDIVIATAIIDTPIHDVVVDQEVEAVVALEVAFEPWPIVAGTEHYQVFVPDEDAPWPEFIPGFHRDFRQPSTLRRLCTGANK